ncbi:hypothetical protein [Mycobacterium sp. DL592]|uniref:CAP domain-containing protein n=1 Tax=Mycobacterium sp. DL592 TaxID=2675524 RepID=UPI001FBBB72A|nr:hypothetical protein [Mycobacterium sp. DL592]
MGVGRASAGVAVLLVMGSCGLSAAAAGAEPLSSLEQAVVAARGTSSCGPLRSDPRLARAADIVNRSTMSYVNHTAENVPADQLHPTAVVKDVGVSGSKVISLAGASHEYGDSVRGVLVEGRDVIPDCSYTDFGSSVIDDGQSGYVFTVVILVGP